MTNATPPLSITTGRHHHERALQPHFVYQFWSHHACIYVGITSNLGQRLTAHQRKDWWDAVKVIKADWYPGKYPALDAERDLIQEHDPWVNKQGVLA